MTAETKGKCLSSSFWQKFLAWKFNKNLISIHFLMVLVGNHHPSSNKTTKKRKKERTPLNNISKTHMSRKIEKPDVVIFNVHQFWSWAITKQRKKKHELRYDWTREKKIDKKKFFLRYIIQCKKSRQIMKTISRLSQEKKKQIEKDNHRSLKTLILCCKWSKQKNLSSKNKFKSRVIPWMKC